MMVCSLSKKVLNVHVQCEVFYKLAVILSKLLGDW